MSIQGLGTDILEIRRIIKPLQNPRFLSRVYTAAEIAYIERKGKSGHESAAGFFCVKEAVMKAFGTGMSGMAFREIEVGHEKSGAPCVILHGRAARLHQERGNARIFVSISHSKEFAVATVILEGPD